MSRVAQPVALSFSLGDRGATSGRMWKGSASAPRATLVLAHGAGAGQDHEFMVQLAMALAARAMAVITFDFSYMHAGKKLPDKLPVLVETMEAVTREVSRRRLAKRSPLVLAGKSMGGRVATHLAAAGADSAAVVVFGYPLTPPRAKRAQDRTSHLAALRCPLLVVQGERDAFGSPSAVRSAIPSGLDAVVVGIDSADHGFARPKRAQTSPVADVLADEVARFLQQQSLV